jgi:uncharacterized protein (TIGR02246 family)
VSDDEKAIRNLLECWHKASREKNLPVLLGLMTDDVVFLTSGQAPMSKDAFATGFALMMEQFDLDSSGDIQELVIAGGYGYCRAYLKVTLTPKQHGTTIRRSGYTLTIFRKENDVWRLTRDANMLTLEKGG